MIVSLTLSSGAFPGLADRLRALGLGVREAPLLTVQSVQDLRPLDAALGRLERHGALAVTSPRAGRLVRQRAQALGVAEPREVWAVGPATARSLPPGWRIRLGQHANARSLAEAIIGAGVRGPVLHPCGVERREELSLLLARAGVATQPINCYAVALAGESEIHSALEGATLVVVGSHRVMRRMAGVTGGVVRPALVCLGPATAATARAAGWEPAVVAGEPTAMGVLRALEAYSNATRRLTANGPAAVSITNTTSVLIAFSRRRARPIAIPVAHIP
ncbi:MAG: uroporphyrinogen-III synthase [Gemmatimonadota bacterium]|nr:uroporphyrinogen-III synthase [Gemmatimonadota bacterium]